MGINSIGKALHKTTLELGKVDGYGNGRRSCAATITVELRQRVYPSNTQDANPKNSAKLGIELAVTGNIYNQRRTDIIQGGQCNRTLRALLSKSQKTETVKKVLDIWDKYHLNTTYCDKDSDKQLPQDVVDFIYTL